MPPKIKNNELQDEIIVKLNTIIENQNQIILNLTNINLENNNIITNLNLTITNNLIEIKNQINSNQITMQDNINKIEEKNNSNIISYANITKQNIENTYEINTSKIISQIESNTKSIIIYNLKEEKEDNFNLRNKNSNSIINDITEILEIKNNIQIMDSYRLGKYNEKETNIRPLKIVLNKTMDQSYFIKNAFKLKDTKYKHIGVVEEYKESDKVTIKNLKIEIKNKLKLDNSKNYYIRKINKDFKIIEVNKNE